MAGTAVGQLVAYGAQDIYLTANPQVTFFKVIYRRYTNFAIESIQVTFNGTTDFGKKANATISRNGDLIWKMYLEIDLPQLVATTGTAAWTRSIGLVLIQEVYIEIGGQKIDDQYGNWMYIWNELTQSAEQYDNYQVMIGNTIALTTQAATVSGATLHVPLEFWFNRNIGLALPLIALQYHEVKLYVQFAPFSQCYAASTGAVVTVPTLSAVYIWVDYIFLDSDERKQFAQVAHEYLIEQVQFTGAESYSQVNVNQRLNFNHPCKALYFVSQLTSNVQSVSAAGLLANRHTDYTDGTTPYQGLDTLAQACLLINGGQRFFPRVGIYFNQVQPYQHFPRGPAVGIYVYSFAIKPSEHQPSGSINMSRIDTATLQMTFTSAAPVNTYVFATNTNVLRVMNGMAGIAYSN
jgi:hypothetical protein